MNERAETIRSLKLRLEAAKQYPDMIIVKFWDRSMDGRKYRRWFRECLNRKINRSLNMTGRKYSDEYQIHQKVDAGIIRDALSRNRFRCGTGILRTPQLQKRYPGINNRMIHEL